MRFITLQEGNLPFKPVRKLQELRYVLLAGTLMSAVAVPQLSVALDGARGTDGRLIVAQREDPKDKNKNKGQPGGQQPKQGGQPPSKGPGPGGQTGQQGGQPGGQGGQPGGQGRPGQGGPQFQQGQQGGAGQ